MKNFIKIQFLLIFAITSCSEKKVNNCLDDFEETKNLKTEEIVLQNIDSESRNMIMFDSLCVLSSNFDETYLSMYNINSKKTIKWLNKGRGEGEILHFSDMHKYNDSILYVDAEPKMCLMFNIHDIEKGDYKCLKNVKYSLRPSRNTVLVNDSTVIYQGENSSKDCLDNRFCMENIKTNKFVSFGEFPKEDEIIFTLPKENSVWFITYQGNIRYNKKKKRAVLFYYGAVGFEIMDTQKQKMEVSKFYQYPIVTITRIECPEFTANRAENVKSSKRGFIDGSCTDTAIYFLYSDKTFEEENKGMGVYVLKYDWKGNPIKKYILDTEITSFSLSEDEQYLYGLSSNDESEFVIKYKL
ncbi:MAG: hypothetical protein IMY73_04195 [Bacteroidetes bacterium]|nr:hypothetical protein [Bacteroidota bacterium]